MALAKPHIGSVSQKFGGDFVSEPSGWYVKAGDGRQLKAYLTHFPGSVSQAHEHKGVDVYAALGTPMYAMEAGTVVFAAATAATGYAKVIRVRIQGHGNVYYSFGHCDSFAVGVGAVVKRGQLIARMGKTGNANGVHDHLVVEVTEKGSDGVTRLMCYDALRFLPAKTYAWGSPYGSGYLPGGNLSGDDRIYPIHNVSIGSGVNVRVSPDTAAPIALTSIAAMTVPQINVVVGGSWTVAGVTGTTWAKVRIPVNGVVQTAYVATALIHPA